MIRIPAFILHALTWWQSGCALALSLLFSLLLSTDVLGASSILPSPTGDLHQAERILDRYGVQLEIDLNYQRIDKDDPLPSGYAARRFLGQTDQVVIEVGIIHASGAGYELYVRTLVELSEVEEAKVLQTFNQTVDAARANPSTPDTSDLAYEIYTLVTFSPTVPSHS